MYLHARQVTVTVGDSGLCCGTCVTYPERHLSPLCVDLALLRSLDRFLPLPFNVQLNTLPSSFSFLYLTQKKYFHISDIRLILLLSC